MLNHRWKAEWRDPSTGENKEIRADSMALLLAQLQTIAEQLSVAYPPEFRIAPVWIW